MTLKESYRYSNYLDGLLASAYTYLRNAMYTTTITEEHLRSKVNPDAKDETLAVKKPYDVTFTPNALIDFVVKVLDEKQKLTDAISVAKVNAELNIDTGAAMNAKRREFVNILNEMARIKSSETQTQGSDYRLNINNEQVKYYYPVTRIMQIDYDRNAVRGLIKKLTNFSDDISTKIEAIQINTIVDHTPLFDLSDTLEDLVA